MDKLKVLLIMAYPQEYTIVKELGLEYIAAVTRQNGNEAMVAYGDDSQLDYEAIKQFRPDIVGFTMYYNTVFSIRSISRRLKKMFKDIVVVAGGALPSMNYEEVLLNEYDIDCVVRGEGEKTWIELLEYLESQGDISKVKGISYRGEKENEIISNPDQDYIKDLDALPFPATNLMLDSSYISTSRGCVKNCSFCISSKFWKKWRGRSPKSVVDEIEHLVNNNGVRYIGFIDNSFEDPDGECLRGLAIAREIINRGVKVVYQVNFRAEFWRKITPEMIETLKKSGLVAVSIGIETANNADRKLYNKTATVEDNYKIVEVLESYGILVNTNFIMFNPYSTFKGLRENIDYLERLNRIEWNNISHSYMTLEGTNLFKKIKVDGLTLPSLYNDPFAYYYRDKRIEPLLTYLYEVPHKWVAEHSHLYTGYLSCLALDRLKYEFAGEAEKYNVIKGYEDRAVELSNTIGHYIATWFRNLLDIAESGWDNDKAIEMENEIASSIELIESLNELYSMAIDTNQELRELQCA
jgi:radical SAM superfamily enzyme YgiQ (UPF0313 family)